MKWWQMPTMHLLLLIVSWGIYLSWLGPFLISAPSTSLVLVGVVLLIGLFVYAVWVSIQLGKFYSLPRE